MELVWFITLIVVITLGVFDVLMWHHQIEINRIEQEIFKEDMFFLEELLGVASKHKGRPKGSKNKKK